MPQPEPNPKPQFVRFGIFEVDLHAGELTRSGRKLKLGGQPLQVLCILLERPGQIVTREELQKQLWPDTFVDVDHNLNTAINKIREALGDSAENPRFVETIPRRGYRFITPVTGAISEKPAEALPISPEPPPKPDPWFRRHVLKLVLLVLALIAVSVTVYTIFVRSSREPRVLSFRKITDDGRRKVGRLATDGSRIYFTEVFPDTGTVMVEVSVKGGNVLPIQSPLKHALVLDISKDGATLLVGNDEGGGNSIWMLPVAGGSPRRIGDNLYDDAVFGPDPNTILVVKGEAVDSINLDGSLARKLLASPRSAQQVPWLQDSPVRYSADNKRVRFGQFDPEIVATAVMEAAADGTGQHRLFPGCCGEWTPDQRYFVYQNDSDVGRSDIWTTHESKSLWGNHSHGKPIRLTSGPLDFQSPLPSRDSREVVAIGSVFQAELSRYDARSNEFVPYLPGVSASGVTFSPDGRWVTYTNYHGNNLWNFHGNNLWRSRVDGSELVQLTFPPMSASQHNWSPDGKQIVFSGTLPGKVDNMYILSSEGGAPQQILPSQERQVDANWSPDGSTLVFASLDEPDKPISILDLKTRRVTLLPDSYGLYSPHWSPNGRYIAALNAKDHHAVLYDFQTGKWTEIFKGAAGFEIWSHNGDDLYFQDFGAVGTSRILRFSMKDRTIQEVANPRKSGRVTTGGLLAGWLGLAPDDSPLVARDISTQEIYALEMDWP